MTYLLPQPHDLEALKVAELLSPDAPLSALCEVGLMPLLLNFMFFPLLLQS